METAGNAWFFWNFISSTKCKEAVRNSSVVSVDAANSRAGIWECECLTSRCTRGKLGAELLVTRLSCFSAHKGAFDRRFCGSVRLRSFSRGFATKEGRRCGRNWRAKGPALGSAASAAAPGREGRAERLGSAARADVSSLSCDHTHKICSFKLARKRRILP